MIDGLRRIPASECDTRDIEKHFFRKNLTLFTFFFKISFSSLTFRFHYQNIVQLRTIK